MHAHDNITGREGIGRAVEQLRQGQVVAMPTETVYGLAGDGLNPRALARIFEVKQRPFFDPLILHVLDLEGVEKLARSIPAPALLLAEHFWPGPLTLILPKRDLVPDLATSGLPNVAVRMPVHPLCRELLKAFGGPLAAPSANRFGRISPTSAEAVFTELGRTIPLILDGGPCQVGLESTIVDCNGPRPLILRAGGVAIEEIEAVVGPADLATPVSEKPLAPGHLAHHYAPRKPLRLIQSLGELSSETDYSETGFLGFDRLPERVFGAQLLLSPTGNLNEAAANFFGMLRALDEAPVQNLIAIKPPERGLGRAINERLGRAQSRAN